MRGHDRGKPPAPWAKLLSDVNAGWPWPYTDEEIDAIQSALPAEIETKITARVVAEARLFMCPPAAAARAIHIKPDLRAQVRRLATAVEEVKTALQNLDVSALRHLEDGATTPDERPMQYLEATFAFAYNSGLENPPEKTANRGRPHKPHIGTFQARIEEFYVEAHRGERPVRGWPKFRDACLDPLDREKPASGKGREKQLAAVKDRNNSPK